jgi:hypothetical protein
MRKEGRVRLSRPRRLDSVGLRRQARPDDMCFGPVGRVQSVCAGGRGEYRGGVIPEAAYVQWARRGCQREGDECWGARLLQLQGPDGHYGGGPYVCPGWTSTTDTLLLLRELGLDPTSEQARRAVAQVVANATWGPEFGNSPFFEGEVEPCIKREGPRRRFVLRRGERLVDRLLNEQLEDGGWNCEAPRSQRSSFHSTICVLEGLLEYENAQGATLAVTGARLRGQEYLVESRRRARPSRGGGRRSGGDEAGCPGTVAARKPPCR